MISGDVDSLDFFFSLDTFSVKLTRAGWIYSLWKDWIFNKADVPALCETD